MEKLITIINGLLDIQWYKSKPLFKARDVSKMLKISDYRRIIKDFPPFLIHGYDSDNNLLINEFGLYKMAMLSKTDIGESIQYAIFECLREESKRIKDTTEIKSIELSSVHRPKTEKIYVFKYRQQSGNPMTKVTNNISISDYKKYKLTYYTFCLNPQVILDKVFEKFSKFRHEKYKDIFTCSSEEIIDEIKKIKYNSIKSDD